MPTATVIFFRMNHSTIQEAVNQLKGGQLVLFCWEEGWSLGCDASQARVAERLSPWKAPDSTDPFVVLIAEIGQLQQYTEKVPEIAWDVVEFAEKPLSVIYPKGKNVAPTLLADDGSLALRLVKENETRSSPIYQLVKRLGRGLATVSVSYVTLPATRRLEEVNHELIRSVDFTLDLNPASHTQPSLSTLIRLELDGQITFLRR
jgi:L-threonylcarbamoyladenylate synthase